MALTTKEFDLSKISISKAKKLDFGGSMCYVNYEGVCNI